MKRIKEFLKDCISAVFVLIMLMLFFATFWAPAFVLALLF